MAKNPNQKVGEFAKLGSGAPSPLVSKSKKQNKKYGLQWGRYIEGEWFNSNYNKFWNRRRDFKEYRAYAQGNQSNDRYKKYINPTGDSAWINLDYSPVAIVPKYVDVVVNSIVDQYYNVTVEAIDPLSKTEKDKERKRLITNMMLQPVLEDISKITKKDYNVAGYTPEDKEELEFHMDTNFKMAVESAVEKAVDYTFQINHFSDEVFRKVVHDIVTLGIGAVRTYTDPQQGIINRYVNPENLIHSYTRDPYFRDTVYFAELIPMTISEIRRRAAGQITETQLKNLAKRVEGKNGNGTLERWDDQYVGAYDDHLNAYNYKYDNFTTWVMDFEVKTTDKHRYVKQETKYTPTFTRKDEDYTPPEKPRYKSEVYDDVYETIYGGYKIVEEDIIFDWGEKTNIPRSDDNINKTELSFKAVAPNLTDDQFTSLVQRMIPYSDGIMRSWLKLQQIQQLQRPPGLMIDVDAAEEIDLGNGELTALDIQDVYDQTGNYYFRGRRYDDMGNSTPVREIASNYVGLLNEQILAYNHNLQQIRDVTGLNEARDATQPSPEQTVGNTKIALMQSNNATKHINDAAFTGIVKRVAEDTVIRIQDILSYSNKLRKTYIAALGREDVMTINMMDKIPMHNFGIMIEVDLNEEEKAYLMQDVQVALKAGQIDIDDKYMVQQIPNLKDAYRYLNMKVRKNKARKQQEEMQRIQAQGQQIQQQSMIESQTAIKEKQAEYTLKDKFEEKQHQRRMREIEAKAMYDLREERLRGEYDLEEERIQEQGDTRQKEIMENRKDERMREEKTIESKLTEQRKKENAKPQNFEEKNDFNLTEILQ